MNSSKDCPPNDRGCRKAIKDWPPRCRKPIEEFWFEKVLAFFRNLKNVVESFMMTEKKNLVVTIRIPVPDHDKVRDALQQTGHVNFDDELRRSGKSFNTDGTILEFRVLHDDLIEIEVIDNPNKVSEATIREKIKSRIADFGSESN